MLARAFPDLKITVQDLPKVRPVFEKELPAELKDRVGFMEHDFFQPQPVKADVYMLNQILHDWPDSEAVSILRAQIPALQPGARIILNEYIDPNDENKGVGSTMALPRSLRQIGTATDLRLMAIFSGKDRLVDAWKNIVEEADKRFEVTSVKANAEGFFVVIEIVWRG
jgi:hypothetical protein